MFFKIFIVILAIFLITIVVGEVYLRNFSFYGIEYFIQLDEKKIKKDTENELNFIASYTLSNLIEAKKDSLLKNTQDVSSASYRIIILGDSIAGGGGLRQGELKFSEIMKDILQHNYPNIDFDILVCETGGWSTTQEVFAYEKYCKNIRHNLVIVAYCQNDDAESYQKIRKINGQLLLVFYKTGIPYLSSIPFNKFFTEQLLIARFINEYSIELLQHHKLNPHVKYCLLRDDKIYRAFKRLYILTKSQGTPVMVVVFPQLVRSANRHDVRMLTLIKKWCKELDWGFIDLMKYYKSYGMKALRVSPKDSIHPNGLGHRIAAETIAEELSGGSSPGLNLAPE